MQKSKNLRKGPVKRILCNFFTSVIYRYVYVKHCGTIKRTKSLSREVASLRRHVRNASMAASEIAYCDSRY